MFTFTPTIHHFGRKVALLYGIIAILAFVYAFPLIHLFGNTDLFVDYWSIALGLTIAGLAIFWLHIPLFAHSQNVKIASILILLLVAANCTDLGALPSFSGIHLISALRFGLGAALLEETLVRGPLLFWLWTRTPQSFSPYWWTAITTSIAFGLLHLVNLNLAEGLTQTLLQVVYTGAMGFAAAALFLSTRNLGFTIIMHLVFDAVAYYFDPSGVSHIDGNWWSVVSLLIMIIVDLLVGVYLLKKTAAADPNRN